MRSRVHFAQFLAALYLLCFLAAGLAPRASADEDVARWMPLGIGSRWVYDSHSETQVTLGKLQHVAEMNGEVVVTMEAAAQSDPNVRVMRSFIRNQTQQGNEITAVRTDLLSYSEGSLLWHANGLEQSGAFFETQGLDRLDPPHVLLKSPFSSGIRWRVGSRTSDHHELEGEQIPMMGEEIESAEYASVETVTTPAGTFDDCLKVVYKKTVSANLPASQAPDAGGSGAEKRIEWFAPGIGVVQRSFETTSQVRRPDGLEIRMTTTSTERLTRYEIKP